MPPNWQRELGAFRLEPVERGMSDAQLFRLHGPSSTEHYLKLWQPDGLAEFRLAEFRNEIERTQWLFGKRVRVPAVVKILDDGVIGAAIMTALPGRHPQDSALPIPDTIAHLARGLRTLHAIPPAGCPFDETTPTRLARAREAITHGDIDSKEFSERNRKHSPQQVYQQVAAEASHIKADIVLVHGDAKFDNLLIDDEGNIGFIDCGHAGRGDRYLDLEAVTSDIEEHFGPQWVASFAKAYGGTKLDPAKLRFFSDLYELF